MTDPLAHVLNIAYRNGGRRFLATYGEDGTDKLRGAITAYAADGGAAVVNSTITALFGNAPSLSDAQIGRLAETLVEDWQPT